jgi:hypothetical protein
MRAEEPATGPVPAPLALPAGRTRGGAAAPPGEDASGVRHSPSTRADVPDRRGATRPFWAEALDLAGVGGADQDRTRT